MPRSINFQVLPVFPLASVSHHGMWTTHKELAWLSERIPDFRKVQATPGQQILAWIRKIAPQFLAAFPDRQSDTMDSTLAVRSPVLLVSLPLTANIFSQRLKNWYSYHPDRIESAKGKSLEPSTTLPLSVIPRQKKPTAIAPWQAYLQLYFKKDSALYREVHADYDDFKAGAEAVRSKYSHLFPALDEAALSIISWLPFFQAVMTERAKNTSAEELASIEEYISNRHRREVDIHERPWDMLPGCENESEPVKKRKYLAQ